MFYNLTFVNQTKIHKSECTVIPQSELVYLHM